MLFSTGIQFEDQDKNFRNIRPFLSKYLMAVNLVFRLWNPDFS